MIYTKAVVFGLCTIYIMLTQVVAPPTLLHQSSLINGITNIVFYNERIYVAGNGTLNVLDTKLNALQTVITCDNGKVPCDNVNKILLIYRYLIFDKLIMCGTGYEGKCQMRDVRALQTIQYTHSKYVVSIDSRYPAVGLVGTPRLSLMMGITDRNNHGVLKSSNFYNSARFVKSDMTTDIKQRLYYILDLIKDEQIMIYFKHAFQGNRFSYFVTNHNRFHRRFVSNLIGISNDYKYKTFKSYAEVELSCMNHGVSYNLIQTSIIVDTPLEGRIFIAAFTKGTDPEQPSGDSVICYTALNQLDDAILNVKKAFEPCIHESQKWPGVCFFRVALSVTPVNLTVGFGLPSSRGYITKLASRIIGGYHVDIHAGTSNGHVIKMNFIGNNRYLTQYEEQWLAHQPVVSMHSEGHDLYITTKNRVYLYKDTDCSEYKTCEATMTTKNPLCGWCVYRSRSTLVAECSDGRNHWLTSNGTCIISLNVEPKRKSIRPAHLSVTLNVTNPPVNADYTTYFCKYKTKKGYIDNGTQFPAKNKGMQQFTCFTPNVSVHTDAILELWTKLSKADPDSLLAQTVFLFYDCSRYLTCGTCIKTLYPDCHWCGDSRTCQLPTSACDVQQIQNIDECPQLLSNPEYFLPSGIENSVIFKAKHLDVSSGLKYSCILSGVNIINYAVRWNETSLLFNLKISTNTTASKEKFHINFKYGNQSDNMIDLDDEFIKTVTVYRCENLAADCTRCKALSSTRYNCGWCDNNKCGYNDRCYKRCPISTITKIVPKNGPRQGGTRVTIYGTDIGVTLSDIKSILIGDSHCTDVNVTLDDDNIDFRHPIIKSISCTTNPVYSRTELGEKEFVFIQVGSLYGRVPSMFTYQEMSISSINPTRGIVSGGTHVTVNGQHLGIGNREVKVMFGSKLVDAQVYPSIPLNVNSDSINFTIQITTPSLPNLLENKLEILNMEILNTKGIKLAEGMFSFTSSLDPVISQIFPKQGFFSGGTTITIKGVFFTYAHEATLLLNDDKFKFKENNCSIERSTKVVCKVPPLNEYYAEYGNSFVIADMVLALDGIKTQFEFQYFLDPMFESVNRSVDDTETNVILVEPGEQLNIKGKRLDSIPSVSDISVTVGVGDCRVTDITDTNITCNPPYKQPLPAIPGALYPEINVTVGNIRVTVGYAKYVEHVSVPESPSWTIIVVAVAISVGVVLIAAVPGIVIFKRTRTRFKIEAVNQHIQMEKMLQETQPHLEVVENEQTAGPYAVIDDVTNPYEEIGTSHFIIEDHGYRDIEYESSSSSYADVLPANEKVHVHDNLDIDNESSRSSYADVLLANEKVKVHDNWDFDNESSRSSYADVLPANEKVKVHDNWDFDNESSRSSYADVLPANEKVKVHDNLDFDNESSRSSYADVPLANEKVKVHDNLDFDHESSSSSYADVLPANEKVKVHDNLDFDHESSSLSYADVLPANEKVKVHDNLDFDHESSSSSYVDVLPTNEKVKVHDNLDFDNESSSSSYVDVLPADSRVVVSKSHSLEPSKRNSQSINNMSFDSKPNDKTDKTLIRISPNITEGTHNSEYTNLADINDETIQTSTDNTFNTLDKKERLQRTN